MVIFSHKYTAGAREAIQAVVDLYTWSVVKIVVSLLIKREFSCDLTVYMSLSFNHMYCSTTFVTKTDRLYWEISIWLDLDSIFRDAKEQLRNKIAMSQNPHLGLQVRPHCLLASLISVMMLNKKPFVKQEEELISGQWGHRTSLYSQEFSSRNCATAKA
jgi:hypothetical protein